MRACREFRKRAPKYALWCSLSVLAFVSLTLSDPNPFGRTVVHRSCWRSARASAPRSSSALTNSLSARHI
eukprot:1721038-Pleurochrysis_carterae.AAC.8